CGTGVTAMGLRGVGDVLGLDIEPKALGCCRNRGLKKLVRAEGNHTPFKDATFDLITSLSVIEHVDDDAGFVREMSRICKDNGRVIFSTSAFDFLWSKHDVANRHKRRYTKKYLRDIINKHFTIEKITYTNCMLFPVIWVGIKISNLLKNDLSNNEGGFYDIPKALNKLLILVLKLESFLLQRINFPFGVSLLCIAKKCKNG
ncbi:MAG: methyltransferase domain-containing protein, partial [Parcubacteria group bacterium]|nr:methyltransferase domain-containing protein [Parcubacteria group bacterium]